MKNQNLKQQVLESIIKRLGLENIENDFEKYYDVPIFSSSDDEGVGLGLDSIDVIEIIIAVKDDFDVKINDEDMQKLNTVSDIANFIESVKSNK